MDTRLFQGIVDDAASSCGATIVALRLQSELAAGARGPGARKTASLGVDGPKHLADPGLASFTLGGPLARSRTRRELIKRRLRGLRETLAWPPAMGRGVRCQRCPTEVATALEPDETLSARDLWSADVPLWADGELLGSLRLFLDAEPKKALLRALRGVGNLTSQRLSQERARQRALARLEAVRRTRTQVAAASVRLRQRLTTDDVLGQIGEELRGFGFESALALLDDEGRLVLRHLSHRPRVAARALRQLGARTLSDLAAPPVEPARMQLVKALLSSPEPIVEVRPHAWLRALFGRRATTLVRERVIATLQLANVLAAPLRGAGDQALGLLFAFPVAELHADLGALADLVLQASWALERSRLRELAFDVSRRMERELDARTQDLRAEVERLVATDLRKDNFLANVSHELRSPLVTVLGYTELLLGERLGALNERQRQCLQVARTSGKRLKQFIEELMDFSRFELTRALPRPAPIELAELVAQACLTLTPRLLERNVSLRQRVPVGCPKAKGDREQLHRVLINLLQNAERHSRDGGRIEVRVEPREDRLVVSVADNGSGVAPEHLAHVFERLYQAGDAAGRSREGMGLGLHIVKSLVEQNGGQVSVESVPGKGATFRFTLPIWRA